MIFAQARLDHPGIFLDILGPDFNGGVFWEPIPRVPVIIDLVGSRRIIFRWQLNFPLLFGAINDFRPVAADYFLGLFVKVWRHFNPKTCMNALESLLVLLEHPEGDVRCSESPANGDALTLIFACPHFPNAGFGYRRFRLGKLLNQINAAVGTTGKTITIFSFALGAEHDGPSLLYTEDIE
jgi:hypothetical protein